MTTKPPTRHVPGFTAEEVVSKIGFCEQLKGGVVMDVVTAEHARIAEGAGACAVMALERVPADIRKHGGVARASDPDVIAAIQKAVSIPVMAKVRIGHFVEAQMLEAMEVDCIDESEVLTPADEQFHVDKRRFKTPFVCGCRDLGEALRRIHEGAAMIRTKGEAGTGNVVEAVRHMRAVWSAIHALRGQDEKVIEKMAVEYRVPAELVAWVAENQKLPVPNFSAGGVATPADASLMMQLGAESVFVGSGIFKSGNPERRAKAIVRAVTHYLDPKVLVEVSSGLGEPMVGIDINTLAAEERLAGRGI
jgi:pyridoxal 5'-phosphate synthase pdxS subunit